TKRIMRNSGYTEHGTPHNHPKHGEVTFVAEKSAPRFTSEEIRSSNRWTLVRKMAEAVANEDWTPTLTEVETIICQDAFTQITENPSYGVAESAYPEYFEEDATDDTFLQIPWPEGPNSTTTQNLNEPFREAGSDASQHHGFISTVLGEIADEPNTEFADRDAIITVLRKVVGKLSPSDRGELTTFVLRNHDVLLNCLEIDNQYSLYKLLVTGIPEESDAALAVGDAIKSYLITTEDYEDLSPLYYMSIPNEHMHMLYRSLAADPSRDEIVFPVLGRFLREYPNHLPHILNDLYETRNMTAISDEEREGIDQILANLMGLSDETNAVLESEEMYNIFRMEDYDTSNKTREFRSKMLDETLQKYQITKEGVFVDIASGTGWLEDDMKNLGYSHTVGLDFTFRHAQIAHEKSGQAVAQADWKALPLKSEAAKVVTCLGRSLPECEGPTVFSKTLGEISRVLEPGGLAIVDMPDPAKGDYAKRLESYRAHMLKFGVPESELDSFFYEISSPDGVHFNDRFIPPREDIEFDLEMQGLEVLEVIEEPIPNSNGDVNLVFITRKVMDVQKHAIKTLSSALKRKARLPKTRSDWVEPKGPTQSN
ncbi:class I SAM-dependent methyltransferase, partial [candidate division WWE3 bacterium]|nr:class I SAM-dependent methyltransferase [candidate division WWE3 bacterium]